LVIIWKRRKRISYVDSIITTRVITHDVLKTLCSSNLCRKTRRHNIFKLLLHRHSTNILLFSIKRYIIIIIILRTDVRCLTHAPAYRVIIIIIVKSSLRRIDIRRGRIVHINYIRIILYIS